MESSLNKITDNDKKLVFSVLSVVAAIALLSLFTWLLIAPVASPMCVFYNIVIVMLPFALLSAVTCRPYIGFAVVSLAECFFYYLNEYVNASRGQYIQFSDVYCIRDALSVAENYPLIFTAEVVLKVLLVLVLTAGYIVAYFMVKRRLMKGVPTALSNTVCAAIALVLFCVPIFAGQLTPRLFSFYVNNMTEEIGLFYSWFSQWRNSEVVEPEGYSAQYADGVLASYPAAEGGEPVNVIVIMNEALADYSLVTDTSVFSQDPLANIHAYTDNCIRGRMWVSCYAGHTANTEFEFLTGCSIALNAGSGTPYLEYIRSEMPSLASDLKAQGYPATAVHPYLRQGWRRPYVYEFMGFDSYISGDDFSALYKDKAEDAGESGNIAKVDFGSDLEYVRGFISDSECYKKVLELVERDNAQGDSSFVFAVTMHNHGGYDTEGFEAMEFLPQEYAEENEYLTGAYYSDLAFKELTDALEEIDEKTVVLMFGDHQPGLQEIFTALDCPVDEDAYADVKQRYCVPYIMWANYDVEWEPCEDISANYISALLKQNAGLPLTEWDSFRLAARQEIPVLTALFAVNNEGTFISTGEAEMSPIISDYRLVQYRRMFDYSSAEE